MPSGERRRGAERGYTLVALAILVTILSILTAAAVPLWSARIQRDKEEELIARGLEIAEAIRIFQKRFGRLPNRLEELSDVEPRSLRRLRRDPMTGDTGWGVIVELPGRGLVSFDSRTGQPLVAVDSDGDGLPDPLPPPPPPPPDGGSVAVGPIHGVKSRTHGEAFQVFLEQQDWGDWEFTVEVLQAAIGKPGPTGLPPRVNALTLGRPFRYPPPGTVKQEEKGTGARPGPRPGPGQRPSPRPAPGGPGGKPG